MPLTNTDATALALDSADHQRARPNLYKLLGFPLAGAAIVALVGDVIS